MADEEVVAAAAAEVYSVSLLDIFLIFSFIGLLVYWWMSKNKDTKPEISGLAGLKQLNTQALSNSSDDSSGFLGKMKKSGIYTIVCLLA